MTEAGATENDVMFGTAGGAGGCVTVTSSPQAARPKARTEAVRQLRMNLFITPPEDC